MYDCHGAIPQNNKCLKPFYHPLQIIAHNFIKINITMALNIVVRNVERIVWYCLQLLVYVLYVIS